MSMSKYSKYLLYIAIVLLSACQSAPKPVVEPAPEPEPVLETVQEEAAALPEPEPEPEPVDFNQQFYEQAITALKAGDTDIALELLQEVSRAAPEKPYVFTNLGLTYFKLEQMDLAEQAFQQAIEQNRNDAIAYNHLGILERQKGQFENALKQYQKSIEIDEDYAAAHLNLGILFDIYLQDLDKALKQYEQYLALIAEEDKQVAGWIVDIQRRIKSSTASQG
ncbi:MAG: tetratricopeptide repeat protein [Pseudomonadota bacterium]